MNVDSEKARAIFTSAVENHEPVQWDEFLGSACGDDTGLRRRVELLLKAHEGEDSFLDRGEETIAQPSIEKPSTQIGPYKLLQQIGEGGMGSVYLAEQKHPVKRRVAIKLIKPGMDSRQITARFDAERQALAMMDHPNIARVFEAGTTDDGRPYFVMELVKGVPLIEFCQQHKLTPQDRLKLFIEVCSAVQHAHQKGIIHRDLKPSNVLVAMFDDVPTIKVIDFGVAKAMNQDLTERTMFTQIGQIIGTIEYMSPEQAQSNQLDIDTRSDIYSLGVLLYELLTGMTPFDKDRLRSAAFDNALRIIREEEPPKPSTRVSAAQKAATVSTGDSDDGKGRLFSMLRGDLDWLIMKAMAKERDRRYETASALAADVQRYLDGEAIEARPPSTSYRLSKFVRKNRSSVVAGTLVSLTLVIATVVSFFGWTRALELQGRLEEALIYRAVVDAMAGNIDTAFAAIDNIGDRSAGKWKTILQALNDVHNGNAEAAVKPMQRLFNDEPDNMVAGSLLAAAYDRSFQANRKEKQIMRLEELRTDDSLEELLYQSVQSVFFSPGTATERIQKLVDENPSWELARVLLAKALYFRAIDTGDWEDAARAADLARESQKRLPPLQTIYAVELLANLTAYHLAPPEFAETKSWLEDSDAAASVLEAKFYSSSIPELATYYLIRHNDPERSLEIMKEFPDRSGITGALTGLQLLTQDFSPVDDGFHRNPYITLAEETDLEQAEQNIRKEIESLKDVSVRSVWYRPPLCVCGEQAKQETIQDWERMRKENDSLLWNLEYALKLLSGRWDLQRGLSEAGESNIKKSLVHFAVGTRALYIEGDREKARQEFEECERFKFFDVDYYYIARAYLKLLDDPNWPHWISRESQSQTI